MRKVHTVPLMSLAMWLCFTLVLQATGSQSILPQNNMPASVSSISGRVTDEQGNPLAAAFVNIYRKSPAGEWEPLVDYTYSDPQGFYTLSNLTAGSYRVGFKPSDTHRSHYYPQAVTLKSAQDIAVKAGENRQQIDVRFSYYSGSLQGRVTTAQGQPIETMQVSVFEDFDHDGQWEVFVNDSTGLTDLSDANGNYLIADLPDGSYRLRFSDLVIGHPNKYGCGNLRYTTIYYPATVNLSTAHTVTIKKGRPTSNLNAQLAESGRIRGKVTGWDGAPLRDILVRSMFDMPEKTYSCMETVTNADGFYELGVPDASHYLGFFTYRPFGPAPILPYATHTPEYYPNANSYAAATPIEVRNRAVVTEIDMQLEPTGAILGTVTDRNGVGLAQIQAVAYGDPDSDGQWEPLRWGLSDAAGAFRVTDLLSGTYRLELEDTRQPPLFHTTSLYHLDTTAYPETGSNLVIEVFEDNFRAIVGAGVIQLAPFAEVNVAPLARLDQILVFSTSVPNTFAAGYSVLANDRDAEQNSLTATLVSSPTRGILALSANGFFTYTPTARATISDTFTYRASDGIHESNSVSVTLSLGEGRNFLPIVAR